MKLNILIPVRNREKQLELILKNLIKIFEKQNIKYNFYIIYQDNNELFNKGYLLNIGFLYALNNNFSNNYLFNDVDIYPLNSDIINYGIELKDDDIYHPYGHKGCIGGFFLINKKTYIKLNGFSNDYKGWGCEDCDLLGRCNLKNINVNREIFYERYNNNFYDHKESYKVRINKCNISNTTTKLIFKFKWNNSILKRKLIVNNDGLNQLNINFIKKIKKDGNITYIYV